MWSTPKVIASSVLVGFMLGLYIADIPEDIGIVVGRRRLRFGTKLLRSNEGKQDNTTLIYMCICRLDWGILFLLYGVIPYSGR